MKLISLVLIGCCLAAAYQPENLQQEWSKFKQDFSKSYKSSEEEDKSFKNFKKNLQMIMEHNKLYENEEVSYEMGLNAFSDKDINEMKNKLMGLKMSESDRLNFLKANKFVPSVSLKDIPDSMDWRSAGAVTPVKNQGACGSCWAFSAVGALESQHFLKTNQLIQLSEQNVVDCSSKDGGCDGGWMASAYDYIRDNGGIDTESSYPYCAKQGKCNFTRENIGATCSGYTTITPGNENDLLEAVANRGPVAVGIDVTSAFQSYRGGVFNDDSCSNQNVNHGVVVVGYGNDNGNDYWLVKNSWGEGWGEGGYIKMSRNKNSQCAIANFALFPNI